MTNETPNWDEFPTIEVLQEDAKIISLHELYQYELKDAEESRAKWSEIVEEGWDTFGGWIEFRLELIRLRAEEASG